jgi:hypothetical protein
MICLINLEKPFCFFFKKPKNKILPTNDKGAGYDKDHIYNLLWILRVSSNAV